MANKDTTGNRAEIASKPATKAKAAKKSSRKEILESNGESEKSDN